MFQIFNWSIGWLPGILRIPLQVVGVILAVVLIIKLVQGILVIVSSVIGFFL